MTGPTRPTPHRSPRKRLTPGRRPLPSQPHRNSTPHDQAVPDKGSLVVVLPGRWRERWGGPEGRCEPPTARVWELRAPSRAPNTVCEAARRSFENRGERFCESPTVALGNKFRLHAVAFGLADRPSVIIRQHLLTEVSLKQLAHGSMMPTEVADLLRRCVLARKSVVISGDQGAGKTTLLRAMVGAIPATERFGTLETDYELLTHLQSRRQNMVALQAKIGLGEVVDGRRIGEYTVADLIPEALRQNLSRLVIGEVRGNEAGAMLQAMQSGAGALTTTHSHSAASTIDRLAARVAAGGVLRLDEAYRQIAYNVHLLVHVSLVDDTWRGGVRKRFISEIRALTGSMENGQPTTHLVYATSRTGEPQVFDPGQGLLDDLAPFAEPTGAPATHRRSAGDPASRERGR